MNYLQKLKKAIEREGTTKEAAEKVGVSSAFLGDVINGKDRMSIPLAYKIDTKLGIDMFPILKAQLQKEWADYLKKMTEE